MKIQLPNNWKPRHDQMPLWNYLENGGKRAIQLAHRRWGKDDVALHNTACQAVKRPGNYWHMLPEYGQARKAIWDAVNPRTGIRRVDEAFPLAIRESTRTQDMMIKLKGGSTWQLIGSDNFNSLVGSPPIGIVFSEFAIANPASWNYLRPILAENDGWAVFITTPRGKNHAYSLYEFAKEDPAWFAGLVTSDESDVFTKEQLAQELAELISELGPEEGMAFFRQEYYCSFDTLISGSYYGSIIDLADTDGRICNVPYDPALPVITAWDLGMGDSTGIWFIQDAKTEYRIIDYYEASGEGFSYYAKYLKELPYDYSEHIMPHDIRVRELGTGKSRYESAQALGIRPITICPSLPVDDGINAVRNVLSKCYFDKKKTAQGLEGLRCYHKEYDEKRKEYKNKPYHDWTSHPSDAFRMFAIGHRVKAPINTVKQIMSRFDFRGTW